MEKKNRSFYLGETLLEWLEEQSTADNRSLNQYVSNLLEKHKREALNGKDWELTNSLIK